MVVSIIVALDANGGIGLNNQLLWHLPNDLKHFKTITTGQTIVMGRKTYESIGRPLPNRTNIIVTRNPHYIANGCVVVHSVQEAIAYGQNNNVTELIIIGGGEIYTQAFPMCQKLYVTHVNCTLKADTFFPEIDSTWFMTKNQPQPIDEKHVYSYCFSWYNKNTNSPT
jgi:dihydrofolate reductase